MSFLLIGLIAGFVVISFTATSIIQILNLMIQDSMGFPLGAW